MLGPLPVLILCLALQPPAERTNPPATASITGKVSFAGDAEKHKPAPIPDFPEDTDCYAFCREQHRREPILREHVALNAQTNPLTIRNVLVHLEAPPSETPPPAEAVVVEMQRCVFRPHVLGVRAGQTLRFVNADDDGMNVHFYSAVNEEANHVLPRRGQQLEFQLKPEPPFLVRSDVHPWTSVWVAVFDHPFFAVTGSDGTFKIADVPPGKYVLEAWHEKFGVLQTSVEVAASERKTVDLAFAPGSFPVAPDKAGRPDSVQRPSATATITGRAIFEGDPNKYQQMIINPAKDHFCVQVGGPIPTEDVILNPWLTPVTIQNVLVYVNEGLGDQAFEPPPAQAFLNFVGCRFVPHAMAMMQGQTLTVTNNDNTHHDVHFLPKLNREFNFSQPKVGMSHSVTPVAEAPFKVKCDVHPWESAWITVFSHPFFGITGNTGSFQIANLPPGKYVLEAWHEKFGVLQASVEVAAGDTKTVDFIFRPR